MKNKITMSVSIDKDLVAILDERAWKDRTSLSRFVEDLIITGGTRLTVPLEFTPKKSDIPKSTD